MPKHYNGASITNVYKREMLRKKTGNGDWLKQYRYWIFDLDGTLTRPQHDFQAIKKALGIPLDADILSYLNALPEGQAKQKYQKLDRIESRLAKQAQPAAGVQALLAALVREGIEVAILTRNSKANAHIVLDVLGVNRYFRSDNVLGREQAPPKPDPEGINRLLLKWCADKTRALMVGDYLYDLLCARNADITAVHVDSRGDFPWSEHMDLGVTDLNQLLDMLEPD